MTDTNTNGTQSGGEGHGGSPAPAPAPAFDLSPIEQRLAKITEAVSTLTRRDRDREVASASERVRAHEANLSAAVERAGRAVDEAERALAEAYDAGDPVKIASATRRVTDAVAQREATRLEKRDFDRAKAQSERREGGSAGARGDESGAAKDTRNLEQWKQQHRDWYGVDTSMTQAAHEIDRDIRKAGVIPVGSKEYFEAIDRRLAQAYPEKFRSTPNNSGGRSNPTGGQAPQSGRIPREVLDTWRTMGINIDDDKTLERMVNGREKLVSKGILPEQPAYGRVI